jgi:hypothetical protein
VRTNVQIFSTVNASCIRFYYTTAVIFVATSVFAQDIHSEEYMRQHDGGDRVEYLQELEHSDPLFYVPPVNDASSPAFNNTSAN